MRTQYSEIIKKRIKNGDITWLLEQFLQYLVIHISYILNKALCGPILGTFVSTYSCNCHCFMCNTLEKGNYFTKQSRLELDTYQVLKIFDDFASLGVKGVGFTGGEPLLREDIMILLRHVKRLGMIAHLNTNALLINQQIVEQLLEVKIDSLAISLDGTNSQTHDSIRGCDGAFLKVLNAIKIVNSLRKKNSASFRLKLVVVVSERNINEILDIVKLALQMEVDCIEFIPIQDFDCNLPISSVDFSNQLDALIEALLLLKKNGISIENSIEHLKLFKHAFSKAESPVRCYAGYNSCVVDCYGNIFPCVPWVSYGLIVADLKKIGLKEFWYSKEYNRIRRRIGNCRRCYLNCQTELNLIFNLTQKIFQSIR